MICADVLASWADETAVHVRILFSSSQQLRQQISLVFFLLLLVEKGDE